MIKTTVYLKTGKELDFYDAKVQHTYQFETLILEVYNTNGKLIAQLFDVAAIVKDENEISFNINVKDVLETLKSKETTITTGKIL